jgi:hypothetical protein
MVLTGVGLCALGVTVGSGVAGFGVCALALGLWGGAVEATRAFDGWLMAHAARHSPDIVVERSILGRAVLRFVSLSAIGWRTQKGFAISDARVWRVRAPAAVDVDAVVERRGLLSRGGVPLDDDAFDKAYVVRAKDIAPAHLASRLTPAARAAMAKLFTSGPLEAIVLSIDGFVEVQLSGRADVRAVIGCGTALAALVEAFGSRGGLGSVRGALRGHSPDGNPVGG